MTILQTHLKTAPRLAVKRRVQVNQHFSLNGGFMRDCGLLVLQTAANAINDIGVAGSNSPKAPAP